MRRTKGPRPARGGTLIEVLIAMAILAMLMVGVLQLFSLSLLTDSGSAARTDMSLKAQQVAENLRYLHYLRKQGGTVPAGSGLPTAPSDGLTTQLPYNSTISTAGWAYWGPSGANVFEQENPPYRISYTYEASPNTAGFWFVTVSVTHADSPTGLAYVGAGAKVKRVDYVCQVPQ